MATKVESQNKQIKAWLGSGKRFARYSLLKEEEQDMNNKTKRLLNALLEYVNSDEKYVLKCGLSIGKTTNDVLEKPYIKELNIKLVYVDKYKLKEYRDERRIEEEG